MRELIIDLVANADALTIEQAGQTLKNAKVLSISTWRQLIKEERERQRKKQTLSAQLKNQSSKNATVEELRQTTTDLATIHAKLSETTSSPHSHDVIELAIATSLSHLLSKDALVWLLIVGPPSSDKTQTALAMKNAPFIFHIDTLTENAFISGFIHPDGNEAQDLLGELNGKCLTIKDMNSLFGQHPDKVGKVLSDLTAIYDGEFAKWTGTRGNVSYAARFSLIGCVTPITLAQHHRYMSVIGPRFLSYRVPELDLMAVNRGLATVWGDTGQAKAELRKLVSAYATQLHEKIVTGAFTIPSFSDQAKEQLNQQARFLAHARAAVRTQGTDIQTAEGNTTRVYDIVEVQREEPFRALLQLRALATALAIVHGREEVTEHEIELCRRVVLSSMPFDRSLILSLFQNPTTPTQNCGLTRKVAAEGIGKARNQAVRLLKELEAIEVLHGVKEYDDEQKNEVWTYFPTSDEFAQLITKPIKALDHRGDLETFPDPPRSFVSAPPQNNVQKSKEIEENEREGESVASVRFMITRDMRQQLADLGYGREAVDSMTPEEAAKIIEDGIMAPQVCEPQDSDETLDDDLEVMEWRG